MKKRFESNTSRWFLSVIFFLSGIALTVLLSLRPMPALYYAVELVLCSIVWGLIAFKYRIVEKVVQCCEKTDAIFSILLSVAFIPTHYQTLNRLIGLIASKGESISAAYETYLNLFVTHKQLFLIPLLTFGAIALCVIFMYISSRTRKKIIYFFRGISGYERVFLAVGGVVSAIIIIVLFNQTNVFYLPETDGNLVSFDALYTFDSGSLLETNSYTNPAAPENDFRQPLFGIFAMPFGLAAKLISYFIPSENAYPICCNILQNILLLITLLLISRMLEVGKEVKIYFLLLSVAAFPYMLFALNMEQYIFALFWTILLIYNSYVHHKTDNVLSVAATGSIMTSALFVIPLMIINKEHTMFIRKGLKMLAMFLALFICGGLIELVYKIKILTSVYMSFFTGNGFIDKFHQFTHFIVSCFIAPCSQVVENSGSVSYWACPTHTTSIFGIIIFAISILSGILFRRKFIAVISIYWAVFALVLICLIGWGTAENGTLLYSLYFFWAFTVLTVLLTDKLLSVSKLIKRLFFIILIASLFLYNLYYMLDVINFGRLYYPVL